MKITIRGSMIFYQEMVRAKQDLEELGHLVETPPGKIADEKGNPIDVKEYYSQRKRATRKEGWIWDRKAEAIREHFRKIKWADSILVLNYKHSDSSGYVGGNTLLEMGLAFHLRKPIFLLNPIPNLPYREEIIAMKPTILRKRHGQWSQVLTLAL